MRLSQASQPTTLADVCAALGGELVGDPQAPVAELASLSTAGPAALSFIAQERYAKQWASSAAACVIVSARLRHLAPPGRSHIVVDDAYAYFARLTQWWLRRMRPAPPAAVDARAAIDPTAQLDEGVSVGPFAVVEAGARIGRGARIGAHAVVGAGCVVGEDTRLGPHVSMAPGCRIGRAGIVHGGVVIGADGFGFAPSAQGWVKIEQLGGVVIGDEVEIGANTCIDRGALEDTEIGDGVKLDNLIQIGHNVKVGARTAMAGCVGVAGSAIIGERCMIGGAAMILGHLRLADDVHISVGSVVMRSILKPGLYSGVFPIDDNAAWEKNAATLRQLHVLRERLRALEARVPPAAAQD
jgi:UDP-3-O-[3-hydroxymyristoyl] glucosamine N-acyltransferase